MNTAKDGITAVEERENKRRNMKRWRESRLCRLLCQRRSCTGWESEGSPYVIRLDHRIEQLRNRIGDE